MSRVRPAGVGALAPAGAALAGLAATRLLPNAAPAGVLVYGAVLGVGTAFLATGLVLVHRTLRFVNFAQAAVGVIAGYTAFVLSGAFGWPLWASLPVALAAAAAVGVLADLLLQRFFDAPRLVPTVVTVVAAALLSRSAAYLDRIPPVAQARRSLANVDLFNDPRLAVPFSQWGIDVAPFRFGTAAVATVVAGAVVLGGLGVLLDRSRLGVAARAVAQNAERALLLGVNVRLVASAVWAASAVLSGLAALVIGFNVSFQPFVSGEAPTVAILLPALAAAVLARMQSIPVAAVAAVTLSAIEQAVTWSFPRHDLVDAGMLVVICAALALRRRPGTRSEHGDASSWAAAAELTPVPPELASLPVVARSRRIAAGLGIAAVLVFPLASSASQANLGSLIAIQAIVALSLVVLTGWAGQVSLGQFAFVAVAAVVSGKLTADAGWSFWIALPATVLLVGALAAGVALPALRIRGMFLAVATLALAVAVQTTLFNRQLFGWLLPESTDRPRLLFVSFAGERSYYYLCVAGLVAAAGVVARLRRGRAGRALIGLRENQPGIESFGISALRTQVAAFAVSGGLAALAGVLLAHHQRSVHAGSFGADASVVMFVMAMIGGISSATGAIAGAAYVGVTSFLIDDPALRNLASSGGLLLLLVLAPGGLASVFHAVRDGALRVVAVRERIVVPALFPDVDAEALARNRTPLAAPLPGHGLGALAGRRYGVDSELYGARRLPAGGEREEVRR